MPLVRSGFSFFPFLASMSLSSLGWDDFFVRAFQPFAAAGLVPARVAVQHKHAYELLSAEGPVAATCTGRLLHLAAGPGDLPAVGDWVAVFPRAGEAQVDIHAVLPRRTKFSRRASGDPDLEQVVAANVDTVLLVTALDQNFNLRRIERYLAGAWESGAQPVVVLNKADLHPDPAAARAEVIAVAGGAPVVVLSALAAAPAAPPPPPCDSVPNSVTRVTEFGSACLGPTLPNPATRVAGFGKGEVALALV
ncbi:MAG: GTPase RsgA, partial [Phycisphaerales bacterium]